MPLSEEKRRAFLATEYRVDAHPELLERPFAFRIGKHSKELEALHRAHGVDRSIFLSAWNPRGEHASDAFNADALARLDARLQELHVLALSGRGVADAGDFPPEESRFLLEVSEALATQLCQEFEQVAYVVARSGHPPELVEVELDGPGPAQGRRSGG